MWCGFDLSPGPFPGKEGESARRPAAVVPRDRFSAGGCGGARQRWHGKPVHAVEQDRGRGGTWMAGCTWWVVCGLPLDSGKIWRPSPPAPLHHGGEGWIPAFAGLRVTGSVGKRSAVVGGVSVDWRVGQGAGIGRDAGQALLAQPAQAGRHRRAARGDGCGTQTVLTRRPGRNGEGYVSTRCP